MAQENPSPDPVSFLEELRSRVASHGPHTCEFNQCPRCGSVEFDVHPYAESLPCGQCGSRYPSQSARHCAFHEAIATKLKEVVQQVRDWYPAEIFGVEGSEGDDLSKLDAKTRAIVQRKCAHMARVVCANILAEFERLTEIEIKTEVEVAEDVLEDEVEEEDDDSGADQSSC